MDTAGHKAAAEFHGVVTDTVDNHGAAVALEPVFEPFQRGGAKGGDGGAGSCVESHQVDDPEQDLPDQVAVHGRGTDGGIVVDTGVHTADSQDGTYDPENRIGQGIAEANSVEDQAADGGNQGAGANEPAGKFGFRGKI